MRSYLVESLSHEVIILLFYNTDCPNPEAVSNGYCNDENNNAECNYDAGDCCGTCVVTEHCSECQCLNGVAGYVSSSLIGDGICHIGFDKSECKYDDGDCCQTPDLVANEICNDETNNGICLFDGGDCCLSSPNTNLCSECSCSTTGVITSPGFPGNYANNLDVSWLIQVPSGQLIEIHFIILYIFSSDQLTIYDGGSNEFPEFGKYSGTKNLPPNQISSSNEVFINFNTDAAYTRDGFKLEYHPHSKYFYP